MEVPCEQLPIPEVPVQPGPSAVITPQEGVTVQQNPTTNNEPIYFSDGVLYSNELSQNDSANDTSNSELVLSNTLIDIYSHLGLVGKILTSGSLATIKLIQACRVISENLADALGITRPKYEYEINLHNQMKEEELNRQKEEEQMYATWRPNPQSEPVVTNVNTNIAVNMETVPVQPEVQQ